MANYRKIMRGMSLEELKGYVEEDQMPPEKLEQISKEDLIDFLDDEGIFEEKFEEERDDYGEMMHPDESDDEFSSHEDPDKD